MVNVDSEEAALRRIFEGEARRSIVKGSTYTASHLATAVITFHVSNVGLNTSWNVVTTAKVHNIAFLCLLCWCAYSRNGTTREPSDFPLS